MDNIKIIENIKVKWGDWAKETLADPIVFRKGKNYDLLREGLKALD